MTADGHDIPAGGEEALRDALMRHAVGAASRSVAKLGGPLSCENIGRFLFDQDCLKYNTEIFYDASELEPHQFAQPVIEGGPARRTCALYVHPWFAARPEYLPLIVAYMAGAINYGSAASPELCEVYGAALLGMTREEFYGCVCRMADLLPLDTGVTDADAKATMVTS
jgi:hypothetical protein